jgi:integrase
MASRGQNLLVDSQIKIAKAEAKDCRLNDGSNLYILIRPNGKKLWRQKYILHGRTRLASHGAYPAVSLRHARELRDLCAKKTARGIDYNEWKAEEKKAKRETFKLVAEDWLDLKSKKWTPRHKGVIERSLEQDVYPKLGSKPVKEIDAELILETAKKVSDRGAHDVGRRVLRRISSIMSYAASVGKVPVNPAIGLSEWMPEDKSARKHFPAIDWSDMPDFLKALKKAELHEQTRLGVRLLMLTFVRPGELRFAWWDEFDFDKKIWVIPADRMKMDNEHKIPLSDQVIEVLEELKVLAGSSDYVLPGRFSQTKPISENTLLYAIYRSGYRGRMTAHGFRSVASGWLNSEAMYQLNEKPHPFNPDAIERQLAHGAENKVRDAYLQVDFMGERTVMMQTWADFIDRCADASGKVVSIKRETA